MLAEYQALDFVDRVFSSFMDNFVIRCRCHLFLAACEEMYAIYVQAYNVRSEAVMPMFRYCEKLC